MNNKVKKLLLSLSIISTVFAQGQTDSLTGRGPVFLTDKQMPNITFVPVSAKPFRMEDLKGKIIILNWWSTTCGPCKKEIPELNGIVQRFQGKDIRFIAIANDVKSKLQPFLNENRFDYEQTIVTDEILSIFDWGYPRNLVIDKNGKVVIDQLGYSADSTLSVKNLIGKEILQLLNTPWATDNK